MVQKTAGALCRRKLFYFVMGAFGMLYPTKDFYNAKHIRLLCHTLQKMMDNPGECHLITMPPRYCKSFIASICFPAWAMGNNPALKFLVVSYGDTLANEHAAAFKAIVTSEWYQELFPGFQITQDKIGHLKTQSGGARLSVSVGGAATGFGADIIIVDDIIKAGDVSSEAKREEAKRSLDETFFSRLDKKDKGHIVAIQQRLHEDDPAAYMETKGFSRLCLKAIAEEDEQWDIDGEIWLRKRNEPLFPELESLETLEAIRKRMTPRVFSAQYQQNPVNVGGNQISWQSVGLYNAPYRRENYYKIIQSWDTACTNEPTSDYSVCVTAGYHVSGVWHILDIHRGRYEFTALEAKAIHMARSWDPHCVLIETANTGHALWDRVKRAFQPSRPNLNQKHILGMNPRLGKEERFFIHQGWLEQKKILLCEDAPWLADFRHEILAFPAGRHDDQIDALFQIFEFLETPRGRGFMNRDPETGRIRRSIRSRRSA